MKRRRFLSAGAMVAAGLALSGNGVTGVSDWDAKQHALNSFDKSDTLAQRTEKLNTLMGTDFKIRAYYPEEWKTAKWNKVGPNHFDEEYFLAATDERLDPRPETKWLWGVYLERNGQRWSGDMNPLEFLHWTAQVALGYRIAKAQQQ